MKHLQCHGTMVMVHYAGHCMQLLMEGVGLPARQPEANCCRLSLFCWFFIGHSIQSRGCGNKGRRSSGSS